MSLGKRLFYSVLISLLVLGYSLGEKFWGGYDDLPLWMVIYWAVLAFSITFLVNTWKKQIKQFIDRINNWAWDLSIWKIAALGIGSMLSIVLFVIIFIVLPMVFFD